VFDFRVLSRIYGRHWCVLCLFGAAGEPVAEARGTEARVFAWSEALVIDWRAEIKGLGIRDDRARIPCCVQELPNQFVLTDLLGTS
jgi:hypothetical protein